MELGLEAISIIADHAAVGAFLGALWGLLVPPSDALNERLALGTAGGGLYGLIVVLRGVESLP